MTATTRLPRSSGRGPPRSRPTARRRRTARPALPRGRRRGAPWRSRPRRPPWHLVDHLAVEHLGHEAGADPVDLVRVAAAPESTGELFGSTAACRSGLCSLRRSPQPVVMVPVPTPATNTDLPPRRADLPRWCGGGCPGWPGWRTGSAPSSRRARGRCAARLFHRLVHAPHRLHQHHLGAVEAQQLLALAAHSLGQRDHRP